VSEEGGRVSSEGSFTDCTYYTLFWIKHEVEDLVQ